MSRVIAPGKWDPINRQVAKIGGFVAGLFLLWVSYRFGVPLMEAVREGRAVSMWDVVLVLVPMALGCAAVLPNVIVPIIYRAIDKVWKDSPEA